MSHKNQALSNFKEFLTEVNAKTKQKVRKFRSDDGTEYINQEFKDYHLKKRILLEPSPPYHSQMNGIAEREMSVTMMEISRSMIFPNSLPTRLWANGVATAADIMNITPNKK